MDLNKVDIVKVLTGIKYRIDSNKVVFINRQTEEIEKALRKGKVYSDELILLKILKERIQHKSAQAQGHITKTQNRRFSNRLHRKSATFKEISILKLESFIRNGTFPEPTDSWNSVESSIADQYFELKHH